MLSSAKGWVTELGFIHLMDSNKLIGKLMLLRIVHHYICHTCFKASFDVDLYAQIKKYLLSQIRASEK